MVVESGTRLTFTSNRRNILSEVAVVRLVRGPFNVSLTPASTPKLRLLLQFNQVGPVGPVVVAGFMS